MKFYYFNSTHWDREWYQPWQEFRKYLVDTTGILLDIFDRDPDFQKFTFDGQTIVLQDVVEIRPDWRPRLEALVKSGKLQVGPWYVMPDEFLVSGEALIRNLLVGRAIAREYGAEPWPIGYICDIFGHIAQLPQILLGFGLSGAVLWRGAPGDSGPYVMWRSPDGSAIPTIRLLTRNGYANFSLEVRGWWNLPQQESEFKRRFQKWVEESQAHWGDALVLSDAFDHGEPCADTNKLLAWIRELYPEAEVVHSDYRDVIADQFRQPEQLPVLKGELIYPCDYRPHGGTQISGTLSSRYDIKQANDRCQDELELLVEPQLACRSAAGDVESLPFLTYLWRHLLQNHAHDSICGCSIDAVHRMMLCRFEEVRSLASRMDEEFRFRDRETVTGMPVLSWIRNWADEDKAKLEVAPDGSYQLLVYNSLPFEVDKVSELEIAFPAVVAYPHRQAEPFGYDFINSFRLFDEAGEELHYSIRSIARNQVRNFYRQDARRYDFYQVVLRTKLRASGWTAFELRASERPVRSFSSLLTGRRSAANGLIALEIADNGTFSLTDLRSGRTYAGQNDYKIEREIGDGWNHAGPTGGFATVGSSSAGVRVTLDGADRAEFEIVRRYEVPRELVFQGGILENYVGIVESRENITFEIRTFVALDRGSDQVAVRTVIDNHLRDFRLQLIVPTGISGDYFAGQAFAVLERPAGRSSGSSSEDYIETEVPDKNFAGIVGKRDERGGLALLAQAGLHEAGCLPGDAGELTVTLLRAFRRTVQTNGETEGQLNKELTFSYALHCFEPGCTNAMLQHRRLALSVANSHYLIRRDFIKNQQADSFLKLSGELAFSALKPADSGKPGEVILRLVNLSARNASGLIHWARPFRTAERCRLDETMEESLAAAGTSLSVAASPWQVVTLKFTF